jgi:hypothetical protein
MSLQVTSLEQLKLIKQAEIVDLGAFDDGTPFVAELKKPNLMELISTGKIPNTLLSTAMTMFKEGSGNMINKSLEDASSLKELVGLMNVLAKASLVTPSYAQLDKLGISLNEPQLMAILMFTQGGVKMLENFRNKQTNNEGSKPSEEI